MGFVEIVVLWWMLVGLYYVLDTFMQDLTDQDNMGLVWYNLIKKVLMLPIMPLFVVVSLLFSGLVVVAKQDESEEQEN